MDKQPQSFGEQAARFSLYAPVVAMVIGLGSMAAKTEDRAVSMTIGGINMLLLISGFILGVIALISMSTYGRERILVRAICGVAFNGLLLGCVLVILLPLLGASNTKHQLVGHWKLTSNANNSLEITFDEGGHFHLHGDAPNLPGGKLDMDGKWIIDRNKFVGVEMQSVNGNDPGSAGGKRGLGIVKEIDDKHFVLKTDNGDERYQRIP